MPAATRINRRGFQRLPAILLIGIVTVACALAGATSAAAATTNLTVTASTTTPIAGQHVTFTVTLVGSDGSTPTGGSVSIIDASRNWGSGPVTNGVATIDVAFPAGNFSVQASYSGLSPWPKAKSGFIAISVGPNALPHTQTTLTGDQSVITSGDKVTFTITVKDIDTGTIPTGTVTLTSGGIDLFPYSQVDVGPGNGGVGTITDPFTPPGTYVVVAQFQGSQYQGSSAEFTLTVKPPAVTSTTTTTTLIANGGSVNIGPSDPVTLHATVIQNVAVSPPAGDVVNFYRQLDGGYKEPLPQGQITWDVTDGSSPATGTAEITTGSWPRGHYTVYAEFVGDAYDIASSGTISLGVSGPIKTTTAYVGDLAGATGTPITLSGKLVDNEGLPIAHESLTLSLNNSASETCTANTGTAGIATCQVTVIEGQGSYPVTASFGGDGELQPSSGDGTVFVTGPAVTAVVTDLPYQGPLTATAGSNESLTFELTDSYGHPVASQPVLISVDGQAYPPAVTTDANGLAILSVNLAVGTHAVTASYAGALVGTRQYQPSVGSGSIVVSKIATSTTGATNPAITFGGAAVLSATLVDANGAPIAGRTVNLSFGTAGVDHCSDVTNASGQVSCTTGAVQSPASATPYVVTATFAGDDTYLESSGSGSIEVDKATTAIVDNVTGNFLLGSPLTLSGTLTSGGKPVAGETLTLTFGGASCTPTAPTDATGTASCTVSGGVPGPTGPTTTAAAFAGDTNYGPASDGKPALVYAYAPGGGSFVVGDQTAAGSVYFWGSQWWKQNSLSAGDKQAVDPAAFKGFAAAPSSPQCGGTWSTGPGNSTPPPNGPLPAYMAVIVTSQNHKAGKVLTGNIVHVVIVKTNAGYDGNPGHAGTGTVVATIC